MASRWSALLDVRPGRHGRVCSALPGSTVYGMEALRARPYGPAAGSGAPLHPGAGRAPAGGIVLTVAALCGDRLVASGPTHVWARVGAARGGAGSTPGGAERSRA